MKNLFVILLTFSSASSFAQSSIILKNKYDEKIAVIECIGSISDQVVSIINQVINGLTVKEIVSTSEGIVINFNENSNADGSALDSVELEKSEMTANGIKCKMTVEL